LFFFNRLLELLNEEKLVSPDVNYEENKEIETTNQKEEAKVCEIQMKSEGVFLELSPFE